LIHKSPAPGLAPAKGTELASLARVVVERSRNRIEPSRLPLNRIRNDSSRTTFDATSNSSATNATNSTNSTPVHPFSQGHAAQAAPRTIGERADVRGARRAEEDRLRAHFTRSSSTPDWTRMTGDEQRAYFTSRFGGQFSQGWLQQNGDPRTSQIINGAFLMVNNREGLSFEAANEALEVARRTYPGATLVTSEADGGRSVPRYLINVPGRGAYSAGDFALSLMHHGVDGAMRWMNGGMGETGDFVAARPASQMSLFRPQPYTLIFGPGAGGSQYFGTGQAGMDAAMRAHPPTNWWE
jgi:hypothetical protein